MKPERRVERTGVHLADVDAVVAGRGKILDPRALPCVTVDEHAIRVRVLPGEEAGA